MIKIDFRTFPDTDVFGHYRVGNNIYKDKATMILESSRLGITADQVQWVFHDETYSKFNWNIDPPGTIKDYYHARARELREKYDYIIINCSGGADSTTVLYSFLQQKLFVDEVVFRCPGAGTSKFSPDRNNHDPSNEFSEYEFAAKPLLNWLSTESPRTKITLHDFSLDIIGDNLTWDENFIHWTGDYLTPGCIVRYSHASIVDHLREFDKGKKIGLIFGIDKPRLKLVNDDLFIYFVDRPVHSALPSAVNNGFTNTEVELFFWAESTAPLICKQAHIIKKWFSRPENARMKYILDTSWLKSSINRTVYESVIKSIIYPDYDLRTFQCNKPAKATYQEWDYWLENFKNTAGYHRFMSGINDFYKKVDNSFLKTMSGNINESANASSFLEKELAPYTSRHYRIGKI
jgi:hypothetical protein